MLSNDLGDRIFERSGENLTNLLKIKFRDLGIRVVYKIEYDETKMKIIVISARSDDQVYREAMRRRSDYGI